jgi:HxlR-like helix-turn-helix
VALSALVLDDNADRQAATANWQLESNRVVRRNVHHQVSPGVKYDLTDWGAVLRPTLDELLKCAASHEDFTDAPPAWKADFWYGRFRPLLRWVSFLAAPSRWSTLSCAEGAAEPPRVSVLRVSIVAAELAGRGLATKQGGVCGPCP